MSYNFERYKIILKEKKYDFLKLFFFKNININNVLQFLKLKNK